VRKPRLATLVAISALAALPVGSAAAEHLSAGAPKIAVLSPMNGEVVTGNALTTRVAISSFHVDGMLAGKAPRSGVGHYHIHLDGVLVNAYGAPQAAISLQNVEPGKHTLTFVLAQNNHTELAGTARNVTFSYEPAKPLPTITPATFSGKPSIRIVSPANGATVHGSVPVRVAVRNFNLSAALFGKPDVAGYGHWHVFLDTPSMPTMMGMTAAKTFRVSLKGVTSGKHKIFAVLADDFHAPVPGTMSAITVDVR
jgi:hypothetical protein